MFTGDINESNEDVTFDSWCLKWFSSPSHTWVHQDQWRWRTCWQNGCFGGCRGGRVLGGLPGGGGVINCKKSPLEGIKDKRKNSSYSAGSFEKRNRPYVNTYLDIGVLQSLFELCNTNVLDNILNSEYSHNQLIEFKYWTLKRQGGGGGNRQHVETDAHLEEDFDKDTTGGSGVIFVELDDGENVPGQRIGGKEMGKETAHWPHFVRLQTVDGLVLQGWNMLELEEWNAGKWNLLFWCYFDTDFYGCLPNPPLLLVLWKSPCKPLGTPCWDCKIWKGGIRGMRMIDHKTSEKHLWRQETNPNYLWAKRPKNLW